MKIKTTFQIQKECDINLLPYIHNPHTFEKEIIEIEEEKWVSIKDLHKFINKKEEFSKTLEEGAYSEERKWIIGTSELLHFIEVKKPYRVRAGKSEGHKR